MFKNFSNKRKFYALLVFICLLSLTAYKRSFKGTFEAISFYNTSKANIAESSNSNYQLLDLKREIAILDNVIGKKAENPTLVQNEILGFLSEQSDNLTLAKIENLHISEDEYFKIYSNTISLKGNFNSLLKTIHDFENKFEYARIASMAFRVERNTKTSNKELYTDIIFQNYEKKQ